MDPRAVSLVPNAWQRYRGLLYRIDARANDDTSQLDKLSSVMVTAWNRLATLAFIQVMSGRFLIR